MSLRINHNVLSLRAHRNVYNTSKAMDQAVTRLSSGLRINSADDDPAGIAISERFRSHIASMEMAERNASYAINMFATAEGALGSIDDKLIRMRALAIEASNGTMSSADRSFLNVEFMQLKSEIDRIANVTNYNGIYMLDGTYSAGAPGGAGQGIKLHIGINNNSLEDFYFVNFADMRASALGLDSTVDLTNTAQSQSAIGVLDAAIITKDTERTRVGSYVSRLNYTVSNLQVSRENAVASESTIRDADMATEMSAYTRAQVMMQSGIAMLAQANNMPNMVAGLLQ
jgi:flagellin